MNRLKLLPLIIAVVFMLTGCPSKNTTPPTNDNNEAELQIIDDNIDLQTDWGTELDSLLGVMDTTSAKVELLNQILSDTVNVLWADTNDQGILIEYTNGMRGGIILDFKDRIEDDPEPPAFDTLRVLHKSISGAVSDSSIPTLKEFHYLASAYNDFQAEDDDIYNFTSSSFRKTGYQRSRATGNNCTISEIINACNSKGIVHISSHGSAWPNKNNIQEVYLQTAETANRATSTTYFNHIRRGELPIVLYGNNHLYFISPALIKSWVDFSENNTFVYLAFCYSYLGNWHSTLVDSCGALAVIGYDWSVSASYDAWWAKRFYWLMNDTSRTEPLKLSEWYLMQDNSYRNTEANKEVTMRYYGSGDLHLWSHIRIRSIDPPSGNVGTQVNVAGIGFGTSQETSTIEFGDITATPISWSDTLIVTTVPEDYESGNVIVTVDEEQSNPFPFHLTLPTIRFDVDTAFITPLDTARLSLNIDGVNPLNVRVVTRHISHTTSLCGSFNQTDSTARLYDCGGYHLGVNYAIARDVRDTTICDTAIVILTIDELLPLNQYINIRFEGVMQFDEACNPGYYILPNVFVFFNHFADNVPLLSWTDSTFEIRDTIETGGTPWYYTDYLDITGKMSQYGEEITELVMYQHRTTYDPSYREWIKVIHAHNIPIIYYSYLYSSMTQYEIRGNELQDYITDLQEYYLETNSDGECIYERTLTGVDWVSTSPSPKLKIELRINE